MKVNLKFAELRQPLFLAGKNFGIKLEPKKHDHAGMTLVYDRAEKELLIGWKGEEAIIPTANVASMTIDALPATEPEPEMARPMRAKVSAQVDTPQSHVFAGPGGGTTGQTRGKVTL